MFFFKESTVPPVWKSMLFDLLIEFRIMSTIIIVYSIGHNIMNTTTSKSKIANAGLAF